MKRFVSIILAAAMLISVIPMSAFAAAAEAIEEARTLPENAPENAVFFEDINASESVDQVEAFYFGSQNMAISENDDRIHIMKICRGGAAEGDASVVVKFVNYTAEYGKNYKLSLLGSDVEPIIENGGFTISDFLAANADSYEEIPLLDSSELESGDYEISDDAITDDFPGLYFNLDFADGEKVKYIAVEALYCEGGDGDAMVGIVLEHPSENVGLWDTFTTSLVIVNEDEEEDAVISIEKSEYYADEDTVTITLVRTGALNDLASVHIYSVDGTAVSGDDYSGCDAEVQFALGIRQREITLQVNHNYSDEEVYFQLKLGTPTGCVIGDGEATVTIAPDSSEALLDTQNYADGITKFDTSRLTQAYYPANNPFINYKYGFTNFDQNGGAYTRTDHWEKKFDHGIVIGFQNRYVYDGARVCLSTDEYQPFTYYHVLLGDDTPKWLMDFPCFKQDHALFDLYFTNNNNLWLYMQARLDRDTTNFATFFHWFQLLKRRFNFTLVQADPLSYTNTESAVSNAYTSTIIPGTSNNQIRLTLDDSLSVSCAKSEYEYARLDYVAFYEDAACTRELYRTYNTSNSRTVTTKLTTSMLTDAFCDGLSYSNDGKGYIGTVYVKPHFSYIDSEIKVEPVEQVQLSGIFATTSTEKTVKVHLGDRIELKGVIPTEYQGIFVPDGVNCKFMDAQGKLIQNGDVTYHYQDTSYTTYLTVNNQKMTIKPEFRGADNSVVVKIKKSEISNGYIKADSDVLKMTKLADDGDYACYRISDVTVHTGEIVSISAHASMDRYLVWTEAVSNNKFGGEVFFFTTNRVKQDNVIYLSTQSLGYDDFTCFNVSGSLYAAEKNLATGISYSNRHTTPMENCNVIAGSQYSTDYNAPVYYAGDASDPDGYFCVQNLKGFPGQQQRMFIHAGAYDFMLTYTVPLVFGATVNMGSVECPVNTTENAYISSVQFVQNGVYVNSSETVRMDGKKLEVSVVVKDGNKYLNGTNVLTEKATKVELLVIDGVLGGIKNIYPATYDSYKQAWTATITKFTPEEPDKYTYGDMFYVRLVTDRQGGYITDGNGDVIDLCKQTSYPMISTGYQIVADQDYKPLQMNISPAISADDLMNPNDEPIDAMGDGKTTKEYARLPFVGAINTVVGCLAPLGFVGGESNPEQNDDTYTPSQGSGSRVRVRVTCYIENLQNNVNRFHIGIQLTTGNKPFEKTGVNPLEPNDLRTSASAASTTKAKLKDNALIYNPKKSGTLMSELSKKTISVSLGFGIYLDFGIVLERDLTGKVIDRDFVFMGLGGYVGGNVFFEKTMYMGLFYAGLEVYFGATMYFGATRNANAIISQDVMSTGNKTDADGNPIVDINDFHFDTGLTMLASVTGYGGAGIKNLVGGRIYVSFLINFTMSNTIRDFYPQLTDDYGLQMSIEVGGQVEYIIVSIPFKAFSWPCVNLGNAKYFRVVEQAHIMYEIALKKLNDNKGKYPQEDEIRARLIDLMCLIGDGDPTGELVSCFNSTRHWLYNETHFLTMHEDNCIDLVTYNWTNLSDDDVEYTVHSRVNSDWVADENLDIQGTYRESNTVPLVADSVPQPGGDIISLGTDSHGNEYMLMVYLEDDPAKSDTQIQTLMYSVYNCTTGTWTTPARLQDDATGDFTPSLTDAGDQIFISWISSDPSAPVSSLETPEDVTGYFRGTEVYGTFIDKASFIAAANSGTITEGVTYTIDRITDDSIYGIDGIVDTMPSAVYDPNAGTAGQTFLFYLKNFENSDNVEAYAYSMENMNSVICYRIYDNASGQWLTDYYDGEMDFESAEEKADYISMWYGQRFLYGPIANNDLPIYDITTCLAYKNHILFAYTVDMDGDINDDSDRELYVQLFDTKNHKLYYPISITDNDVAETQPRLISNAFPHVDETDGELLDRSAYLFWVEDHAQLNYIDVVDLIRHGLVVDGTGTLKDDYKLMPVTVYMNDDYEHGAQLSEYEVFTDINDDLYVLRAVTKSDKNAAADDYAMPAKEIYASALVRFKDTDAAEQLSNLASIDSSAASLLTTTGSAIVFDWDGKDPDDPDNLAAERMTRYLVSKQWSDPVRLTTENKANDSISAAVASDGKLYILHNQYTVTRTPEGTEPFETSPIDLMLTVCDPASSVEVTKFTLSDDTPNPGDKVIVTAEVSNTGLTTAKGYSAEFYETKGSTMTKMVPLPNSDGIDYQKLWLAPGESHSYEFEWTVPSTFEGTRFCCISTENGYSDQIINYSDPVQKKAEYEFGIIDITQSGDTFTAEISVENTGNGTSAEGDMLHLDLAGLYGPLSLIYGVDDKMLTTCELDNLAAGERRTYMVDFKVPESVFDYCGYDQLDVAITDKDENGLTNIFSKLLVLQEPLSFSAGGEKGVTLAIGGTFKPEATDGNDNLDMYDTFILASDDDSIATVENGVIMGVNPGSTIVRVRSKLYGNEAEIAVTVTGETYVPPVETPAEDEFVFPFVDVTEDDFYYDAVAWAVKNNITSGTDATHFSPMSICTRAQMVTFLWNASGHPEPKTTDNPFTDVKTTDYFYKPVLWAYENGITAGTSKDKFSPDRIVSRAQAVTFLANMAGVKAASGDFDHDFVDVKATDYYDAAVGWAYENDITAGTGHNKFSPDSDCLRYQIIMFLYKYFN